MENNIWSQKTCETCQYQYNKVCRKNPPQLVGRDNQSFYPSVYFERWNSQPKTADEVTKPISQGYIVACSHFKEDDK